MIEILEAEILKELDGLHYLDYLSDGEIMCIIEKWAYEYNIHSLHDFGTLKVLYSSIYGKR